MPFYHHQTADLDVIYDSVSDRIYDFRTHLLLVCVSCDAIAEPGETSLCRRCLKEAGMKATKDMPRMPDRKTLMSGRVLQR